MDLGRVELDPDRRIGLGEVAQDRREQGDGEELVDGDLDRSARLARLGGGGVGDQRRTGFHRLGRVDQGFAAGVSTYPVDRRSNKETPSAVSSAASRRAAVVWLTRIALPAASVLPVRATARK